MKAVILSGGVGTRLSEETDSKPKPLIEIGGKPILWHIMKIYSSHGINDFIICLGYKGYLIKEYFANYFLHVSDVTFDIAKNKMEVHRALVEPWKITLIDTGEKTMTGGRLKRVASYLGEEDFCLTYGDGVGNVDIKSCIDQHKLSGNLATVTAVRPPSRFGSLKIEKNKVLDFQEKPEGDSGWISGGFFVLSPRVIEYIKGDETSWESEPMKQLANEGNLSIFFHRGFWEPMDTLWEKIHLEDLWNTGKAPWKTWE